MRAALGQLIRVYHGPPNRSMWKVLKFPNLGVFLPGSMEYYLDLLIVLCGCPGAAWEDVIKWQ